MSGTEMFFNWITTQVFQSMLGSQRVGKAPGDLQEKCPPILVPIRLHGAEL